MVRLTRIYTRGGDRGMTSLGDGTRVPKTHRRITAYGTVDELNSVLGVAAALRGLAAADRELLRRLQNDLFDLGADLCVPRRAHEDSARHLRIVPEQVAVLEAAIDERNERLQPLKSFVLPGGTASAAALHQARTVCRRAEIEVARLLEMEPEAVGEQVLPYLNRLSDLLFVMARCANRMGRSDVLWRPGAGRSSQAVPVRKSRSQGRRGARPDERRSKRPRARRSEAAGRRSPRRRR